MHDNWPCPPKWNKNFNIKIRDKIKEKNANFKYEFWTLKLYIRKVKAATVS